MTDGALLEISGLGLRYGDTEILSEVSLTVRSGETVGLVGESGSGKSSTIRAALGLLPSGAVTGGSVRIRAVEMLGADPDVIRRVRAHDVGLIQQDPRTAFNPLRRIGDSITERLVHVHGVHRRQALEIGRDLLEAVGITRVDDRMRQYPHQLSGGMLQRVAIAAALTTRPDLILADEATSALDVTTQAEVLAILRDRQRERGLGILFITHDLLLASAFCDRVAVMSHGRIVEILPGAELFRAAEHEYTRGLIRASPGRNR